MQISFKRIPLIFIIDAISVDSAKTFASNWQDRISASGIEGQAMQSVMMGLAAVIPGWDTSSVSLRNKLVIPMLVNPQSFSVTKNPRVTKTLTKKGLLTQSWQAEPDIVNIAGRAASNRSFFVLSQLDALSKTMENGSRNIVTMVYKFGGIYRGYIENMKLAVDAEQPGIFDYTFDFQFIDRNHFKLFLMSFKVSSLNEALQNPKKFVKEQVRMGKYDLRNNSSISIPKI